MTLSVDSDAIGQRGGLIRSFLQPIASVSGGPAWDTVRIAKRFIIGTHDGSPPLSDYRDWRFSTPASRCHAAYYEVWDQSGRRWYLERAYLNMYETTHDGETPLVSVHCDPQFPGSTIRDSYKQGPHVHFKKVGDPLARAHLAVHGGFLTEVTASVDSLTKTMAWAIQMMRDEILDRLP